MNETMFIIEFVNGKQKRFDDNRFRIERDLAQNTLQVYSRVNGNIVLDVPNVDNIMYVHYNIIKKDRRRSITTTEETVDSVEEYMSPDDTVEALPEE